MLQFIKAISIIKSDLVGISASIACIVHCLAAPALVSFGYVFNVSLVGQWHLLDYLFIGMAVVAVYFSTKNTAPFILKMFFWLIVALFAGSILFHEMYQGLEILTLVSSLLLICLHFYRLRMVASKNLALKTK